MGFTVSIGSGGKQGASSTIGRGCGTVFFGLFFAVGALFTAFMLVETWNQIAPWWWPETECTIVTSGVVETGDDQDPYRAEVQYRYETAGRVFESDQFFRGDDGTASYDRARDRAARYTPGAPAECRVDPDRPSEAVLAPRLPWIGLLVFFPLIFVTIGGVGLWATWRRERPSSEGAVESISEAAPPAKGFKAMVGFGLLFVVVGFAVFVPMTLLPAIRLAAAMLWHETPCTVVDARMRSWSTDDGTSYRADVLYEYEAGGRPWRSNRLVFFGFVNSGHEAARTFLDRYPDGAAATCRVDPRDLSRSVLEWRVGPRHLIGLFPLIFVAAGAAVAAAGRKQLRSQRSRDEPMVHETPEVTGPLLLEPQVGPVGKVLGALLFALIWNGIVSVFVWQVIKAFQVGRPDWFLTLFMIPFVLVGLFSLGLVGYFLLALVNPRPRITITPGRPRLGEALRLEWSFTGRSNRLRHLRIFLEGREEATYRRGTRTHTDREVFRTIDVIDTPHDWELARGNGEIVIPEETMHSFDGGSNKIVWEIKVKGDISRWPDVDQSFPVDIRPLATGGP